MFYSSWDIESSQDYSIVSHVFIFYLRVDFSVQCRARRFEQENA